MSDDHKVKQLSPPKDDWMSLKKVIPRISEIIQYKAERLRATLSLASV